VIDYWVEGEGWGVGTWGWRRRLFEWEENLLIELLEVREEEDEWSWELEDNGTFSVRSVYLALGNVFVPETMLSEQELRVLKYIWKSPAPSKVIAFSWKLLRNRIPTRANLAYRRVEVNSGVLGVCSLS
jgi:hypothetical protein